MNLILLTVLAFLSLSCSGQTIDIPECTYPSLDPTTNTPCPAEYGYNEQWIVDLASSTPNGVNYQYMTVNGAWPPPPIVVNLGQRIRIELVNNLPTDEPITLHFHGLHQENGYTVMDGPMGVIQSGVTGLGNFTYDFPANNAGTFWVHSHAPGQYPKGLRTPLIVRDPDDPASLGYDGDYDHFITISDWWPNFWATETLYDNNMCGPGIEDPPVDHIVNDLKAEWSHPGNSTSLGYYVPEGTTARLRFINMAAFSEYYVFFAVGGVPLTTEVQVVELDGVLVDRLPNTGSVTGFSISSGQRVSILFSGLPAGESIQVIFISEPRINAGNSNCPLIPTWTSPPNGAQYSWTHVDSVLVDPIRNAPPANTFDGKHSDGTLVSQLMLRQWTQCTMVSGSCLEPPACDYNPRPYFTQRVKVPMNYQDREVLAKGTCEGTGSYTVLAPTDAFGFNDYYYTARDNEPAWIVDTPNFSWIHPIYMVDHTSTDTNKGKGEMGSVMESAPLVASDLPNSLWVNPESTQGSTPNPVYTTSLLQALRDDVDAGSYNSPYYYTNGFDHTVVMPVADEAHWFVIRTTKGDHPIHMHGHEFQILARLPSSLYSDGSSMDFVDDPVVDSISSLPGAGTFNSLKVNVINAAITYPVRRDTIMIEKGWTYVLAVKATNPGIWALHCHNDFHASTGMFMQIVERAGDLRDMLGTWKPIYGTTLACPPGTFEYTFQVSLSGSLTQNYSHEYGIYDLWPAWSQVLIGSLGFYGWIVGGSGVNACLTQTGF